ncbi:hypothetical protein M0R88_10755 [Halorussus gelatinilyticus]|uniref:Uncharacterized protein n=1 Tax=Halorussus gelatinilyticus TaxID=2937524 RepID=A0A8U0IE68_9EURY|nr:hypothetical protein [Halorussus gelatinilyticus]UPV99005.1 hypothetical protein M0R88_10755 [Halorussus gelatinilyticus]
MTDDSTFDRRSFLRRASGAGLLGVSGLGGLRSRTRGRESDGARTAQDGTDGGDDTNEEGPINYLQAVLPRGDILDADLVYRIVVVGGPIQPGTRPPPLCFPETEDQWLARNALVVKPTQSTGIFGDDDIGEVNESRIHLESPVPVGAVYRIAGGEYCDGYAQVTIHELPPQLSEYFSKDMLDTIRTFEANETASTETTADGAPAALGNETAGNATDDT